MVSQEVQAIPVIILNTNQILLWGKKNKSFLNKLFKKRKKQPELIEEEYEMANINKIDEDFIDLGTEENEEIEKAAKS